MRGTRIFKIRQVDMLIGKDLEGDHIGLIYCGISQFLLWKITMKCFSQNCRIPGRWELMRTRQDW